MVAVSVELEGGIPRAESWSEHHASPGLIRSVVR